jgi:hypothetical protein
MDLNPVQNGLGAAQLPVQMAPGSLLEIKRPGPGVDHPSGHVAVTLRRVRATIFAVKKQQVLRILREFSWP